MQIGYFQTVKVEILSVMPLSGAKPDHLFYVYL